MNYLLPDLKIDSIVVQVLKNDFPGKNITSGTK